MADFEDRFKDISKRAGSIAKDVGERLREANAARSHQAQTAPVQTSPHVSALQTEPMSDPFPFEKVRKSPKGTYVEHEGDGVVMLRVRAVVRFWWMLPYPLALITVFGSLPLGAFIGTAFNPYSPFEQAAWASWFNTSMFMVPVLLLAATVVSYFSTHVWIRFTATKDYVRVNRKYYRRDQYGGMRIGYEIKTRSGVLKNDFHDLTLGMQALRLSYGPWGEDLPYLVNSYHAPAIVIWLNLKMNQVIGPVSSPAETGERKQTFG